MYLHHALWHIIICGMIGIVPKVLCVGKLFYLPVYLEREKKIKIIYNLQSSLSKVPSVWKQPPQSLHFSSHTPRASQLSQSFTLWARGTCVLLGTIWAIPHSILDPHLPHLQIKIKLNQSIESWSVFREHKLSMIEHKCLKLSNKLERLIQILLN